MVGSAPPEICGGYSLMQKVNYWDFKDFCLVIALIENSALSFASASWAPVLHSITDRKWRQSLIL
jgi:hypothetical protein